MSSTGALSRRHSRTSANSNPVGARHLPPTTLTPVNPEAQFEPCAATASFLLYAQGKTILVLHHDTLAIERRFNGHSEPVTWIAVDNTRERGGRLAVSSDNGKTTVVWDILTGAEVSRFTSYENILVAAFMQNGIVALGNEQGNVVTFDPATQEHESARTIYDPITAISPSSDCRTYAIGYMNGSILIATLKPFTILHTLTTTRAPSRITGLAWHASSTKQKPDMLATQTADGDLRVWSVPKPPSTEHPNIVRVLHRADVPSSGPCWFAWSKAGRVVQYAEGETRAWDVRTRHVSWDLVPTGNDVIGMANYGPSATLFTLSRSHIVQQFDITPDNVPMQVASVQHMPANNTPPTPPTNLEDHRNPFTGSESATSEGQTLPNFSETGESSADEAVFGSPTRRKPSELELLESESRDIVMPLSPTSSRASSTSSRSSGARRRGRKYLYDAPDSSRASSSSYQATEFSMGIASARPGHDSISVRSVSSFASAGNSRYRPTTLRREVVRSPQEVHQEKPAVDLFQFVRAKLRETPFRTPHYGNAVRTPELLQREMLSAVFGWNDTAAALVREEMGRHRAGTTNNIILSVWLGEAGTYNVTSFINTEGMSSADWMKIAVALGGQDQRAIEEALVQRLLEKDDLHAAAAILLRSNQFNDAIEVYVSQQYWLEAVLLTCITCPADWGRISYMLRKWGEAAIAQQEPELAVRCLSCTTIETSEPWFSPRAQDAVYAAQQERFTQPPSVASPPLSPPTRTASGRLAAKNAALKLITNFGENGVPLGVDTATPMNAVGVTPIAQSAMPSALTPGGMDPWQTQRTRTVRDPSSARTATPGGFSRRNRVPSRTDTSRSRYETNDNYATPITTTREYAPSGSTSHSRRTSSLGGSSHEPQTAVRSDRLEVGLRDDTHLPSPAQGVFTRLKDSQAHHGAMERKPEGLAVNVMNTRYIDAASPGPETGDSRSNVLSPPLTDGSVRSGKSRAINEYISSVAEAREQAREKRTQSRPRGESRKRDTSRSGRGASRPRDLSETRGRNNNVHYIKSAKRSPSSPIPMSPEEIALASNSNKAEPATTDDESFYKLASPVDSHKSMRSTKSDPRSERRRPSVATTADDAPPLPTKPRSRAQSRQRSPDSSRLRAESRGRSDARTIGSTARSPSSPLPMRTDQQGNAELDETNSDGRRVRLRAGSRTEGSQSRGASRTRRERSSSRRPVLGDESNLSMAASQLSKSSVTDASQVSSVSGTSSLRPRGMSRKELAAKELEERRLSLARRPSAPAIPLPGEFGHGRPGLGMRSNTELGNSPTSYTPPFSRAQTVDPDAMAKYGRMTGTSTSSVPIGLPATPRAMRHPRYMGSEFGKGDNTPPVPEVPDNASQLSSIGSNLSQLTGSNVESNLMSNVTSNLTFNMSQLTSNMSQLTANSSVVTSNASQLSTSELDDGVAPLLPSTVFGQKPPNRSASAPPEKMSGGYSFSKQGLPQSNRRLSHVRKISPPDVSQAAKSPTGAVSSIDETLAGDHQVIIVPERPEDPPVLPELQHLNGPPPPPPPPTMYSLPTGGQGSGMISIAMDDNAPSAAEPFNILPSTTYPQPMERATTASPSAHRRGRGSVSDTFSTRFRGFGDRMRSTSRNRTKSPQDYGPSPYESVLPPFPPQHRRGESIGRAKSPYELAMAAQNISIQDHIPPPPPPPPAPPAAGMEGRIYETSIPPSTLPRSQSAQAMGYRNPKEIRANMPPSTLQQGVQGGFL